MGARTWCFTTFNLDNFSDSCAEEEDSPIRYLVFQSELCPETNREHIQGYVEFTKVMRMATVKTLFKDQTMHLEKRRGTRDEARAYCQKLDTRIPNTTPTEYGTWKTDQGHRTDLTELVVDVKSGLGDLELLDKYPSQTFRYLRHIQNVRFTCQSEKGKRHLRTDLHVTVITGAPGTGKTSWAFHNAAYGDVFILHPPTTKGSTLWFDGYAGEKTLIIDDYAEECIPYATILNLLDIYPVRLQVKGSTVMAQWTQVIITSNIQPISWYPFGSHNQDALERRIHCKMTMTACDMTLDPPTWTYECTKGEVKKKAGQPSSPDESMDVADFTDTDND